MRGDSWEVEEGDCTRDHMASASQPPQGLVQIPPNSEHPLQTEVLLQACGSHSPPWLLFCGGLSPLLSSNHRPGQQGPRSQGRLEDRMVAIFLLSCLMGRTQGNSGFGAGPEEASEPALDALLVSTA